MQANVLSKVPATELAELRNSCIGWMSGHCPHLSMRSALEELIALPEAAQALDVLGEGSVIASLERDVAALLGKPAAMFMPKGIAAQLATLRAWVGQNANALIAVHPQSHMVVDEEQALNLLVGLRTAHLGSLDHPFSVDALRAMQEPPDVVVVELPLRRGGFRLPPWDELVAISMWCRKHRIPLHFDGARLWESAPFYGRTLANISALADSVYVSLYKGLGGLAGCVVAGSQDFIESLRPWQWRIGANIYTVFPYVLSALEGLRRYLPRMDEYSKRAKRLAAALGQIEGVRIAPDPPQMNSFQLHLPSDPLRLTQAMLDFARSNRFWLGARVIPSHILPQGGMIEVVIGDAANAWDDDTVAAHIRTVLKAAKP